MVTDPGVVKQESCITMERKASQILLLEMLIRNKRPQLPSLLTCGGTINDIRKQQNLLKALMSIG